MSSELRWFLALYDDLLTWFPDERVEVLRDRRHAEKRIAGGDLSFVSKELPAAHNRLLAALETSGPAPQDLHLGWLARKCLDPSDPYQQAMALKCHRQLCHVLYKVVVPYDEALLKEVFQHYVDVEGAVTEYAARIEQPRQGLATILSTAKEVLRRALPGREEGFANFLREHWGFTPKHGPGSVATGEKDEDKWQFSRKYSHLHARFPYYEYFVLRGGDSLLRRLSWYRSLQDLDHPISKMVAVPKDSRGPRLICEEPLEIQYIQQGYLRLMTKWAHSGPASGHVFFECQDTNRNLALSSSADGRYATLDLRDASDRVSRSLVKAIFPAPIFRDLDAMRSTHTTLPDGRVLPLSKMSPMGSAVCFPTMAFTLWAMCVVAMMYHHGHEDFSHMHEYDVYIFGDDIIVPVDVVPWVISILTTVGLEVNKGKSYWKGPFRESCGVDAINGFDVTPTRVRHFARRRATSVESTLAWYAYINAFRAKGFESCAQAMERILSESGPIQYTWDQEMIPGVMVPRDRDLGCPTRYSKRNGAVMALAWAPSPVSSPSTLAGELRLLRDLTQGSGEEPDVVTRRGEVKMRRRWRRALRP